METSIVIKFLTFKFNFGKEWVEKGMKWIQYIGNIYQKDFGHRYSWHALLTAYINTHLLAHSLFITGVNSHYHHLMDERT